MAKYPVHIFGIFRASVSNINISVRILAQDHFYVHVSHNIEQDTYANPY